MLGVVFEGEIRYNCSIKMVSSRASNTEDMRQPYWRLSVSDHIVCVPQKQCYICQQYYPETGEYFRPTRGNGVRSKFEPRCRFCHNAIRNKQLFLIYPSGTDKYKPCSVCHNFLLRSEFYKDNASRDGLCFACKECQSKQQGVKHHLVRLEAPDGMKYCRKIDKCLNLNGSLLPATLEYFFAENTATDGLRSYCKVCDAARNKNYVERNFSKLKESGRQYRLRNRTEIAARHKEWSRLNFKKRLIYKQRRKARLKELPANFSEVDWCNALNYWNGCCAICSRPLNDLFGTHKAAMDHWIPLTSPDCPGTIASNILPLCHGIEGCNNRKRDDEPRSWVLQTFGKTKGFKILSAIDRYFATLEGKS